MAGEAVGGQGGNGWTRGRERVAQGHGHPPKAARQTPKETTEATKKGRRGGTVTHAAPHTKNTHDHHSWAIDATAVTLVRRPPATAVILGFRRRP